ncbi:hypothetical protein QQ045_004218 [Rhodiola kirilowii]
MQAGDVGDAMKALAQISSGGFVLGQISPQGQDLGQFLQRGNLVSMLYPQGQLVMPKKKQVKEGQQVQSCLFVSHKQNFQHDFFYVICPRNCLKLIPFDPEKDEDSHIGQGGQVPNQEQQQSKILSRGENDRNLAQSHFCQQYYFALLTFNPGIQEKLFLSHGGKIHPLFTKGKKLSALIMCKEGKVQRVPKSPTT